MTVHSITVQIVAPKGDDPGQVTEGFYTVEDDHLQMVYRDGRKLENPLYRVKLHGGANVQAIAANLTRAVRKEMLGEKVEGFTRNLSYPKASYA